MTELSPKARKKLQALIDSVKNMPDPQNTTPDTIAVAANHITETYRRPGGARLIRISARIPEDIQE